MPETDWNLIIQANISLIWSQWSIDPKNRDKTIGKLLREFRKQYIVPPLNIGSLLMAAYILFVYPQQAEFDKVDFERISTDGFYVHEGTPTTESRRFCSRIRNGLSHGRFKVGDNQIELTDQQRDGRDPFRATIQIDKFGEFINQFMSEVKKQYFERKQAH